MVVRAVMLTLLEKARGAMLGLTIRIELLSGTRDCQVAGASGRKV